MQNPTVVVIGNFDGVHAGHRQVLERARAAEPDLPLVVVTFWPHPTSVVHPEAAPRLLTDLQTRIALLRAAGADEVRVVHFTADVASQSPEQFTDSVLRPLNPRRIVVGENFRFGHQASGTAETLRSLGEWQVDTLPMVEIDQLATCSTLVRQLVADGDVAEAAEQLGRPFRFAGVVIMGHQRGRDLGCPTANLPVPHDFVAPSDGVYAGFVTRLDRPGAECWPAAISVGTNPTFDDVPDRVVEAHVLGRDDLELYGVPIAVDFIERLRGNVRFEGVEQLVVQMAADCTRAADITAAVAASQRPAGQRIDNDLR